METAKGILAGFGITALLALVVLGISKVVSAYTDIKEFIDYRMDHRLEIFKLDVITDIKQDYLSYIKNIYDRLETLENDNLEHREIFDQLAELEKFVAQPTGISPGD